VATNKSIEFFEKQFVNQVRKGEMSLNSFEVSAIPFLSGRVLDYGCGMGNLALVAAERGCTVVALDSSAAAITHITHQASLRHLNVIAEQADLREHAIDGEFEAVVSIGLLMFFDCETAFRVLEDLKSKVSRGGVAVINVLVEGTTYLEMFDGQGHCIFSKTELETRFSGWEIIHSEFSQFVAPGDTQKVFATVIARRPVYSAAIN
jgi:tellurite methyltransferase